MGARVPKVSIGLPVQNGEPFLAQAIGALRVQTFADWELIISDNASTDRTGEFCVEQAAEDPRICYHRCDRNVGAAANFNRVLELARGPYFKWAAHDDVFLPEYLAQCVATLDEDPEAVLCHSRSVFIDADNQVIGKFRDETAFDAPTPQQRFAQMIGSWGHGCVAVFGVMRTELLRQTPGIAPFVGSDRNLLAELCLLGKLRLVPEYLFAMREHADRSVRKFAAERQRLQWFDPQLREGGHAPTIRRVLEYGHSIERARLRAESKEACLKALEDWCRTAMHYSRQAVAEILRRESLALTEEELPCTAAEAGFAKQYLQARPVGDILRELQ